jgi:hypothetical protein
MEIEPILKDTKHQSLLRDSRLPQVVLAARANLQELDSTLRTALSPRKSANKVSSVRHIAYLKLYQRLKELQRVMLTIRINLTAMLDVFVA